MYVSIRLKLLAILAMNLVLMTALGIFATLQMRTMFERSAFVSDHTIPSLQTVDEINLVVASYRARQLEYMLLTARSDKERLDGEMAELERTMARYLDGYAPLISSPEEALAVQQLRDAWNTFVVATRERFMVAVRDNNTGSVQPAFTRLEPLYNNLLARSEALASENQKQALDTVTDVAATYRNAATFILAVTAGTLVISAVIGFIITSRVSWALGRLTGATLQVAGGDLARSVSVPSHDELGLLASSFNQMVTSVREQRRLLEERNDALQQSLAIQRQLTEDVIRGKRAEEEAERARAAAEAASQAKSLFIATMSHELRTPLNAILGYAQLLHLEAQLRGHSDMVPDLDRIQVAGKHLLTIITNILDISKIEQGKMDLEYLPVEIEILVRDVLNTVQPLAEQRGNQLVFLPEAQLGTIVVDPVRLRQVLYNLLSNAAKFTSRGTITLRIQRCHQDGSDRMRFIVEDTGIGISPEQLARLFQPFIQADASTTRRYGGTGLGLALSRQLCHMMHGSISAESEPGAGSRFTVELPVDTPPGLRNASTLASSPIVQPEAALVRTGAAL